uniref:Uncharacterized protein n=1 Tax=Megaselia scalaris TaxID=36166 RepID=T1GQ72_MEGSC
IVFFTALFYLLASSDTKYAPLQIGTYFGFSSGNKLGDALENSISGVLLSMFKCCIFQGLFTWLVHTVLGARVVFLPSALAAILSAAPFLGSYWCALPAFLELWTIHTVQQKMMLTIKHLAQMSTWVVIHQCST